MIEIIKSFEQTASRLSPAVVVVPAVTMTAVGLEDPAPNPELLSVEGSDS